MSKADSPGVFLVIGVLLMLSLVVDAQPTVGEDGSCEFDAFDETATARDLKLIREDLAEVKNLLGSRQQSCSALNSSSLFNCIPLLIQQNINGSDFFNRSWEEFKVGFNDSRGNYWLGNELLHQLTVKNPYKLRFDLQYRDGSWYYAEYSMFVVSSEAQNYKLEVSGYSGNAGDAFSYHNNTMFTTYDRDNDHWSDNCAVSNGSGFWYKACSFASVNTVRGFSWFANGRNTYLQSSRMWLMC